MTSRPLKHLARRPIATRDIAKFLASFHRLPDQAAALVNAAWVERSLEKIILSRMVRLTRTQRAELFVGFAPLSTFSTKIKIAYALRIIGRAALDDLEIIKDIRNQFAHSFHPITFQTRAIADACRRLKLPEKTYAVGLTKRDRVKTEIDPRGARDPRIRFASTCGFIVIALAARTARGPRPQRLRNPTSAILY